MSPTSETTPQYSGCGYSWNVGGWSGWSSTCSSSATRTRSVSCRRSDGSTVHDAFCSTARPSANEVSAQYGGCSFSASYGTWSSCSSGGEQTRSVTCTRSDGVQVAASNCGVTVDSGNKETRSCTPAPSFPTEFDVVWYARDGSYWVPFGNSTCTGSLIGVSDGTNGNMPLGTRCVADWVSGTMARDAMVRPNQALRMSSWPSGGSSGVQRLYYSGRASNPNDPYVTQYVLSYRNSWKLPRLISLGATGVGYYDLSSKGMGGWAAPYDSRNAPYPGVAGRVYVGQVEDENARSAAWMAQGGVYTYEDFMNGVIPPW
jgi:hypothetical protein